MGNRRGQRNDLKLRENFYEDKQFKGRTDLQIAKLAGFNNQTTYRQAKRVMEFGASELIKLMDSESIAISVLALLTYCSFSEQQQMAH
ncbi:MAG: hypothetical protein JSR33_09970 [Proteobacteria bacterium]|nr:hypothetical protein [Pseudomonadota bacterium]